MAKKKRRNWKQKSHAPNQRDTSRDNISNAQAENLTDRAKALSKIKLETYNCVFCAQPIHDLPSALSDKQTGDPVHFDCVLDYLKKTETIGQNEKLFYIGKGNFAIAYFENPHDLRKFEIRKLIEWESKDKEEPWRTEITDLYSQVE